ncbi:hypothetical protein LEMLEM_LOCUS27848 [Lemmus lemmus]
MLGHQHQKSLAPHLLPVLQPQPSSGLRFLNSMKDQI